MCLSGQRKLHIKDKEILYNLGHLFEWLIDVVIDYLLTLVCSYPNPCDFLSSVEHKRTNVHAALFHELKGQKSIINVQFV